MTFVRNVDLMKLLKGILDQYQNKGMADIYWRNFAIECKCYAGKGSTFAQEKWWAQACESAGDRFNPSA